MSSERSRSSIGPTLGFRLPLLRAKPEAGCREATFHLGNPFPAGLGSPWVGERRYLAFPTRERGIACRTFAQLPLSLALSPGFAARRRKRKDVSDRIDRGFLL